MKRHWKCTLVVVTLSSLILTGSGFNTDRNAVKVTVLQNDSLSASWEDSVQCFSEPDIDVASLFNNFDFNASWIRKKYFWNSEDFDFEGRYKEHVNNVMRNNQVIKVIVLPHSHNDPGWLNTYDEYFYRQTRAILDNAVAKLTEFKDMTFLWSEITYLSKWWQDISSHSRKRFKALLEEGRLEIATGGWVMPDEATSSLFAFVHQLTEGQQWVKNHLNIKPEIAWSIDPFGYSSTYSHLLKASDMKAMVIQRLHYAWKHYFAENKAEEFRWKPRWDNSGAFDMPCLTLPYDLYSIKHACGPEPEVCLRFDFRSIPYEYGENYGRMTPITRKTVEKSSWDIAAQYMKTASLTNHNVVLVPLGDDFRYDRTVEWVQQYSNYQQLFSHINANKDVFRMDIGFGTLREYFESISQQKDSIEPRPSLSGDFFPYGDVYVSGKPSYWTGFYGSRPYWKRFYREVENELRSAEILFTCAHALTRQANMSSANTEYADLVRARQEFGIFAHHDGVTGTAKRWTMEDYGYRLLIAYKKSIDVQIHSINTLHHQLSGKELPPMSKDFLRDDFAKLPAKLPLEVFQNNEYTTKVMLFNNLAWEREELIKVFVKNPNVQVTNSQGHPVISQVNPIFVYDEFQNSSVSIGISSRVYELVFIARLQPLTLSVFQITLEQQGAPTTNTIASVHCAKCIDLTSSVFTAEQSQQQDTLSIDNDKMVLRFLPNGLLRQVELVTENRSFATEMSFGMYKPAKRESGAYLLKLDSSPEHKFFGKPHLIRITGPVMSQITSIHSSRYETLGVNTTLINFSNFTTQNQVLVETFVDFTRDFTNAVEVFMRLNTDLNTSQSQDEEIPVMFTDQNGFVSERRVHVPALGYEGNSYPVTAISHIQDEEAKVRLSMLVDRTHGFCSMERGRLEALIERKSTYDDGRGLSEGVFDSKPTVSSYLIVLENLEGNEAMDKSGINTFSHWQPTLSTQKASLGLQYPPNMYVYHDATDGNMKDADIPLFSSHLPPDAHLLTLRTLSLPWLNESVEMSREIPSDSALMNVQYLTSFNDDIEKCSNQTEITRTKDRLSKLTPVFQLNNVKTTKIRATTLTGVSKRDEDEKPLGSSGNPLLINFKLFFSPLPALP